MSQTRRLAAILAADVAGYSRLMGADEEGTLERLKVLRRELLDPKIGEHHGRIVKTTGDGLLVEFASVVDGLRCASEWQRGMVERNAGLPDATRIEFRIGVHQGDIVVEDGDIFGDGVNVAARLEGLAEPGGICVSARVQEDVTGRLDLAFDDIGEQSLKNIARPVRVYRVRLSAAENMPKSAAVDAAPLLPLPDKPSIAVLPFANMSGDPEQEYFVDGVVEEIITALSRIRWLFVIARNSSFTYKGQPVDVKRVGRELGVRYVLEGSVRKVGQRVRITGQLIDAITDTHLWADRFDGTLEDIFELQDKVALSVAGVIEPTVQAAEIRRAGIRPTNDLTAYDFYLRSLPHVFSQERDEYALALDLLGRAIERDPHYGSALAHAAYCHVGLYDNGWTDDPETNRRTSIDLARRSLRIGPDDPDVLAIAAFVLGRSGEDIDAAVGLIDRCLALNPSFARGWHWSAVLRNYAGHPDLALEHFDMSLRLSPRDRLGFYLTPIGVALFFMRRFDQAAGKLLASLDQNPTFAVTYRFLASCYAHMGRLDEARAIVTRLKAITPVIVPSDIPYRNPEHRELFLSGLRLAAGEAT
jgi:TolB-like protein/class 3 adenylate cyclase/tetratricopeptide (TPR) repeat protein